MTARDAFAYLNRIAGIAPLRAPAFTGEDPIMPTPFSGGPGLGGLGRARRVGVA